MKRFVYNIFTIVVVALITCFSAKAETVNLGGTDYTIETKIDRELAPGVRYMRLRLPDYPLNVNLLKVDMTNQNVIVETTVANEKSRGTELLTSAAKRHTSAGHKPVAAANGNFWGTKSEYPHGEVFSGIAKNASMRNGKLVTESNQYLDPWDGGTQRTGVVGITEDNKVYADYCTSAIRVTIGENRIPVHVCNKAPKPGELCMYNSFYGSTTQFFPIRVYNKDTDGKKWYEKAEAGNCTELLLDIKEGETWGTARDMTFIVKEVRTKAGDGTLGNHDLALVGNGNSYSKYYFKDVKPGDEVTLEYHWTFDKPDGSRSHPKFTQIIGGNAMVMVKGELTDHNSNEDYNSMVYSRTGYGCSDDHNTLYVIVIDKSTDPDYGTSAGCSTAIMSELARHYGCYNLSNFDAGGSAEMMIEGKIVNKTTETTPRQVANGLMIFTKE